MRMKFYKKAKTIELPVWLEAALSEEILLSEKERTATHIVIHQKKGIFYTSLSEDTEFDTIEAAYDSLTREQRGEHLVFDKKSLKGYGEFFFKKDNTSIILNSSCRLLMGKSDHNIGTIEMLKDFYNEWVNEINPKYQKHPNDWFLAYEWLTNHPAFWTREYDTLGQSSWVTDEGIETTHSFVYQKGRKKFICIETGSHVAPEYKMRYLDLELTVQEKTFEKAYVELAKRINAQYQIDGSDG